MASIPDWLARTFFVDEELQQTQTEVAENLQRRLNEQKAAGTIDWYEHASMSNEVAGTRGDVFYDAELGKPGASGLPGLALSYWWIFAILALIAFLYFGGGHWIRRKFA